MNGNDLFHQLLQQLQQTYRPIMLLTELQQHSDIMVWTQLQQQHDAVMLPTQPSPIMLLQQMQQQLLSALQWQLQVLHQSQQMELLQQLLPAATMTLETTVAQVHRTADGAPALTCTRHKVKSAITIISSDSEEDEPKIKRAKTTEKPASKRDAAAVKRLKRVQSPGDSDSEDEGLDVITKEVEDYLQREDVSCCKLSIVHLPVHLPHGATDIQASRYQ
ncbi:hypothetical protein ONE63_003442 [Megalurothrips usitatus]|uniref:Uncharacterized protein n=1 Tax=Megalurothrips usitatus TaxID=439358 RepID=A0AAV7XAU0_9NEOP|nr:hypothetical protein ONE63_003442 [Megalurothrips usitatus]